jgi:hypothetical protein
MTVADKVLSFYKSLNLTVALPGNVEVMNPYQDDIAFKLCSQFYHKFFNDNGRRNLILGINPGRFGGGITGVPFTDPIKLQEKCGIQNNLKKKSELSADFIYLMIDALGGPEQFYKQFYISALSPLGFVQDGKNVNYYDIKELLIAVEPFMINCIETQIQFGIDREVCFCLGEGENYRYLQKLNEKYKFFKRIEPLAHPRFIMQYKRKYIHEYIEHYRSKLKLPSE